MDWLNDNWIIGLVTSVVGGLFVAWFIKHLSRRRPSTRSVTRARWLVPISIGIVVAVFLLTDSFWLDRDTPVIPSSERSTVGAKDDVGSVENRLTDVPKSVVEAGNLTEDIGVVVDRRRCDTMLNEIRRIPFAKDLDAAVDNIVLELINVSRNASDAAMTANLECAERLAKVSHFAKNKDRVLSRIIETNIQVGRCRAARELTNHLHFAKSQSEQKAEVARKCLGRD